MDCPHCTEEVELTWRRYLKAPSGRYICPYCGGRFRMRHTFKYHATLFGLTVMFAGSSVGFALIFGETLFQALGVYLICVIIFMLPIDKKIDSTWCGVVPLKVKDD